MLVELVSAASNISVPPSEPIAAVGSDEDGAIALFLGTVRLHNRGREVIHLEYEAYPAMAESEMTKIATEAR